MAEHSLVNNNTKDVNCNTPIGNSIESARRVLYDNTQYNVPYNTPAVNQIPISQRLIFSDQPSPQNVNTNSLPLEAVLSDIYTKLNKIDSIPALLGNLEALPSIDRRLGAIENRFSNMETEIMQIKHDIKQLENRVSGSEINTTNITQRLNMVERERDQMKFENDELRERLVGCSISFNEGKSFVWGYRGAREEKLGIEDEIRFHVVHRLRPRRDRKNRTIVAKFERRKNRDRVLKAAPGKLKESPYSVYEQFPNEIMERRNILWPVFKREQRMGKNVKFKEDKLYVNGQRIFPLRMCSKCEHKDINNFDVLNVPEGYSSFSKCRKQFAKKSGGITVIFKNELKDILNFQNTDCEFVLWVKIENIIEQKHLLLGCIYIPPENSKYSSQESFDQIERELLSFKTESTVTALIGDFNARSSTLTDKIVPYDKLMRFLNIDEINDVHNYLYEFQKLQEKNIPVERSSEDRGRCNNYGYKMLNLCKNNSTFIANGRICDDAGIGKFTCSEISIVDYFIVSPELFPFITEFQVVDFDPLISDVHCRLHVKFSTLATNDLHNNNPVEGASKPVRWISDKKNQFVDKVENSLLLDVDELTNRIDEFDVNSISFQTDLDTFVEALNKLYLDSAIDTFGTRTVYSNTQRKADQPWFDDQCHEKRNAFHKAKKKYNRLKNDDNLRKLQSAAKSYTFRMYKCYQEYQFKLENDLRATSESEPRELWKILNKLNRSADRQSKISID
ncbi:unnamed protein product [Mytilus coruscus]|uniref:Endonuclease/exonuclease/phosphatase domain-containing protein n=1 Tax=Mytilus coruscus TaxID=42192 RepID=A0A6J8CRJ6_MYTCO|nr:unnamed protein product [Mytilus coruscus]